MHASTGPAVIRLRIAAFRKQAARDGLTSDSDLAERLGMNRITVWRLLTERMPPGERFIAAALAAFPKARFEDLFEVVTPAADSRTAA